MEHFRITGRLLVIANDQGYLKLIFQPAWSPVTLVLAKVVVAATTQELSLNGSGLRNLL